MPGRANPSAAAAARVPSMYDAVTGLPGPDLFRDRLMVAASLAKRNDWLLALMKIDMQQVSRLARLDGDDVHDRALNAIVLRLSARLRTGDTLSRASGDHLCYLLVNPDGRESIRRVAQRVRDRIKRPLELDDRTLVIAPRIGIAVFPDDGVDAEEMASKALSAMRRANKSGLSYLFFDPAKDSRWDDA